MDAQLLAFAKRLAVGLTLAIAIGWCAPACASGYRTTNFTVVAPTPQLAKEIGDAAEQWRRDLSIEWLGKELPNWSQPCPIKATVAPHLGAGGATSFVFDRGEVFNWDMKIQGSRERILDSVLPHEITHTIFASHFRQPVPRWADEGACTTVEHRSEVAKQERMLIEFLTTHRGIGFQDMFAMKEYPQDVLPLYAQGHSLSTFLIGQRGRREFLSFLGDGMRDENWQRALKAHYGYPHLLALQNSWMDWVRSGRPALHGADDATLVADAQPAIQPNGGGVTAAVTAASGPMARPAAPSEAGWTAAAPQASLPKTSAPSIDPSVTPTAGAPAVASATSTAHVSVYDTPQTRATMWR
jgi:hypothetical protein